MGYFILSDIFHFHAADIMLLDIS